MTHFHNPIKEFCDIVDEMGDIVFANHSNNLSSRQLDLIAGRRRVYQKVSGEAQHIHLQLFRYDSLVGVRRRGKRKIFEIFIQSLDGDFVSGIIKG